MIPLQFWIVATVITLAKSRPKLDRVEERNEELSGPDITFYYHNPPNADYVVREEETPDSIHRLSKRLAEDDDLTNQKLVYLDPIVVIDDNTYSNFIKPSKSEDSNEDDLEVAAAIVYRPLFVYRLQKSKRLERRRRPRSIHSSLPFDSKTKLLYRTDNDLISKVIVIFLPVYTYKGQGYENEDLRTTKTPVDTIEQKRQEMNEILNVRALNSVEEPNENEDGDPLQPAESSVVHPLFIYKYRVKYYEKKEERKKKKREQ